MSLSRTLSGGERPVFEVERDSIVSIRHRRLQELEVDAYEEKIKLAYRRLAKFYHPDVYDGRGTLEEGETAETRFIKIQAAYELLLDGEKRRQYDSDNRVNPMKAKTQYMPKRKMLPQVNGVPAKFPACPLVLTTFP